ncbi:ATP-binding cassette domain-containing protein [Peptoniphilus sp.]|uniref:ATP-binding cassette domain-containing protein n=1 Tax=Peptoniphilus sp. TaxID=1971214 RepID=UPI0029088FD0|nr:ABC transporter ATP-binding protein [Peptoniphilus harei]
MLEFKNFSLAYENYEGKENTIFENINLSFEGGSVNVISGQSGSGKSTFIKLINGIIPEVNNAKISGQLLFKGKNLFDQGISDRSQYISTVFQNPKNQFYCINSSDEMAFALENRNVKREEILSKIDYYTRIFGTDKLLDRDLFKLSGGEKQLVAITSVALMDNEIYIFDEPSASLDNKSIERLKNIIEILKEKKKIIIIAEHRLYYLRDIMDKLFVIEDKKINFYEREALNDEFIRNHKLRSLKEIKKEDLNKEKYIKKSFFDKNFDHDKIMECRNFFCKYRGSDKVIFDFNLSFDGGIYFIIGENGIGKTSFIRNICGLNKGQRGDLYYGSEKIRRPYEKISLVMQDVNYQLFTDSVYSEMSIVSDNDLLKEKILRDLGLWDKKGRHPQALSGGEKQRLALGLALASKKGIVLLDEPTSGLCQKNMTKLISFLKEMKKQNKTIIIITHDYEFIKSADENILEFVNEKY